MTEHEYEEWFDKYLRNVESVYSDTSESIFEHIPKKFNKVRWIVACCLVLAVTLGLSALLAFCDIINNFWLLSWISNALLNLSIGLIASIAMLLYTNIKDRNAIFYSEAIPVLIERYNDMKKAYFDYTFKINICFHNSDFQGCYDAWHANCNACFVILNFIEYLKEKFPYNPESLAMTDSQLQEAKDALSDANERIQQEFFEFGRISDQTRIACCNATQYGFLGLCEIKSLIHELKRSFYGVQFGDTLSEDTDENL